MSVRSIQKDLEALHRRIIEVQKQVRVLQINSAIHGSKQITKILQATEFLIERAAESVETVLPNKGEGSHG